MTTDLKALSENLRSQLDSLCHLLVSLSGQAMRRIPADKENLPAFGRELAGTVSLLGMYNRSLIGRIVKGEANEGQRDSSWLAEMDKWADLPKRQPPSRLVERKLREAFETLRLTLVPLDRQALAQVPPRSEDIIEFLTLSIEVQAQLAWFLEVAWFQRTFPEKPPTWVRDLGKLDPPHVPPTRRN